MDYEIEKLGKKVGRSFIKNHHYSGGCSNAAMIWGLIDEGELVGAIAFATPISENVRKSIFGEEYKDHVTELHRLYTQERLPQNTESWFISQALDRLKEYKPKYWGVVSFADSTEGHLGKVYQASNALYYGTSDTATFYRDQSGTLRHPRQCGENITKAEAKERGWTPEKRESKHRYLFLLSDGVRHRRMLQNELEVEIQDYPKQTIAAD